MTAGLYVHIPFCLTRCGYCDFNAYADKGHLRSRYARALVAEAGGYAAAWSDEVVDTVFFGGGTPTMLEAGELGGLLSALRNAFWIRPEAEVTIEANPDTVDEAKLAALRGAGFTRLSVGAQSFDTGVLAALERAHGTGAIRRAFGAARAAGFENVNLDLIYGAEGESLASWCRTLEAALTLEPEHISAYALTVEPATPLGRRVAAGAAPAPDGDLQARMYDVACEMLGGAGYEHYEISNWAKPGKSCAHNLHYWRRDPYLGLGAGAHSFRGGKRWWNLRPPEQYLRELESGRAPVGGREVLGPQEERMESVFLGLRTAAGVPVEAVAEARAAAYLDEGLLVRSNGSFVATERGMFLANDLAIALAR
jgi:oxygen-independent coproporphyrinogen-3 oxidase